MGPQALLGLVALATMASVGLLYLGLLFVSILGMVLDTVDILVALFAPRHRTGKGLILRGTSTAHHPHDELGNKLVLCCPRIVAIVGFAGHFLFIHFTPCWSVAAYRRCR